MILRAPLQYGTRIISVKSVTENRGNIGKFNQYDPDKFYENGPERYFTTTSANLRQTQHSDHLLKDTYRSSLNDQPLGPAYSNYNKGEKRSKYRKPLKIQLQGSENRNIGVDVHNGDADFTRKGYRSIPNEREITEERTYEGNLSTGISNHTVGLLDELKGTTKQTLTTNETNGFLNNGVLKSQNRVQDELRKTKKQTTIESHNNGNITGFNKLTRGYNDPETTIKESTLSGYTGVAGSAGYTGNMSTTNYMNAETNPNKEIISQGRQPTLSNTKIVNGPENQNIEIKKLDSDYMNQSENKLSKVYPSSRSKASYELTTMGNRLDDQSLMSDRIDKDILNPFINNPYTQSLSSFAY